MFGHRVRGKFVKYRWKNLSISVDLDLNSMVVEHRIDPFIFQLLKKVRPKKWIFRLKPAFHYSGSVADKAGLGVDDEVVSMNDENIENMTFDQVRKILKERNLRGSIKLVVRTYEGTIALFTAFTLDDFLFVTCTDLLDDNSQTVISAPTTDHSRTPSPHKPIYTTPTPSMSSPTHAQSLKSPPVPPRPSSSLNIFTPKPYRSSNDISNSHESVGLLSLFSSLDPSSQSRN